MDGDQEDSLFARMLSGDWTIETDENDCIFLDRDPQSFAFLLQCLRHGGDRRWIAVHQAHKPSDVTAMIRNSTFFCCDRVPSSKCTCVIAANKSHYKLRGCCNDGQECMARIIEAYNSKRTYNTLYDFVQEGARCAALKEGAAVYFIQYVQLSHGDAQLEFVLKNSSAMEILVACASHIGARERIFANVLVMVDGAIDRRARFVVYVLHLHRYTSTAIDRRLTKPLSAKFSEGLSRCLCF